MKSNKRKTIEIIVCVIMIGVSLLFLFPIIWMIANSFKGDSQIIQDMNTFGAFIPPTLDRNFFSNYITIIQNSDLMKYMAKYSFLCSYTYSAKCFSKWFSGICTC